MTPITWMEVMYDAPGKADQATCKAILRQFDRAYLTPTDMDWAMQQLERHRLSHGVGIHDYLIAAVCHRLQVPTDSAAYLRHELNAEPLMQIIACSPDTPRFPPPYHAVDVFEIQDKVIASILADVAQQEAAAIVHKPVAEEQTLASQVLQGHLNNPEVDRRELRGLRKFLAQPLVGASVQQ